MRSHIPREKIENTGGLSGMSDIFQSLHMNTVYPSGSATVANAAIHAILKGDSEEEIRRSVILALDNGANLEHVDHGGALHFWFI